MMSGNRIPIVIGVTGHRDLRPSDTPALEQCVREFFSGLRANYGNTPLLVLSPLADGADRLVARLAVDEFEAGLVVPLPLPRAMYEDDFTSPGSRREFNTLMERAGHVFEMGLVEGATAESISLAGQDRSRQYEAAGAWIARNCQILVALWDGRKTDLRGSTCAIVEIKLGEVVDPGCPYRDQLGRRECGPVHHIVTPRARGGSAKAPAITGATIYPALWGDGKLARREWDNSLGRIDRFNGEVASPDTALQRSMEQSLSWESGPEPEIHSELIGFHAAADALAVRHKTHWKRSMVSLIALAVTAISAFICYDDLFLEASWSYLLLAAYLGIFGAAYAVHFASRRRNYEDRYLEYRALAEALRVQLHWRRAGVDAVAADHYLHNHRTDLEWIRAAIRNCDLQSAMLAISSGRTAAAAIRDAKEHWLDGQERFFAGAVARNEGVGRRLNRAVAALVLSAFLASVILTVAHSVIAEHRLLQNGAIAGIGLILALAAALKGYATTMAFAEESRQYRQLEGFYRRAGECLAPLMEAGRIDEARTVLLEVGREALRENGDWLLLHRARPLEVPAG